MEPGIVLDELRDAATTRAHFGPDPATHSRNTLGGMIGNNSCGIHSMMSGRLSTTSMNWKLSLYDGTRITVGATSDQRSGTNHSGGWQKR